MLTEFIKFPAPAPGWPLFCVFFCVFFLSFSPPFSLWGEPVGWGRGHLVYASTSARDPPRCVFVGGGRGGRGLVCVRVCVCRRVHGNL